MRAAWVLAAVVVLGAATWLLYPRGDRPRSSPARIDAPPEAPQPKPPAGAGRTPGVTAELRAALEAGEPVATQAAAAFLRRRLRTNPEARARAEAELLAADTPRDLRMALALVLGTIGESDPVLLEALARFRDDAGLARCLILALGATRDPPDDDDVFGMGDRPWGVAGPGGLGITVRREIEDAAVGNALRAGLADERGRVREAAALALRHSTSHSAVRSAFLETLRAEASDDVATVLGEALAVWAGGRGGAETTAVVGVLLARAGDEGLDGYRFRMEDDFRRIGLDEAQQATLAEYAQPAHSYAVRSFALSALRRRPAARRLCEHLLRTDADAAIRDLCARLLGRMPRDTGTLVALIVASSDDAAWNVRYQAVDALGWFRADRAARAAIQAATEDPDARVAKRAKELAR